MKDLYKHLGISPAASRQEIQEAIESYSTISVAEDAKYVLLDRDKKRVFDRCNGSLKQIGKLRANLGLNYSPNWVKHNFSDYHFTATRNKSVVEEILSQDYRADKKDTTKTNTHKGHSKEEPYMMKTIVWFFVFVSVIYFVSYATQDDLSLNSNTTYNPKSTNSETVESKDVTENQSAEEKSTPRALEFLKNRQEEERLKELESKQTINFNKSPEPLPINGYTYNYTSREPLAPLKIVTPVYSDHHYVVLSNYNTGKTAFILFVRGGKSTEVLVPLGTYSIKYATGKDWYGIGDLFGPGDMTTRFKSDDVLSFEIEDNYYTGYTIELFKREGGNMNTREVSASEW